MADQHDVEVPVEPATGLSGEIGTSLASVWARYFGARPSKAETQIDGSAVHWVLAGGTKAFEKGMAAEGKSAEAGLQGRTITGYKRDTSAAVAKVTGRAVKARITKNDPKTGVATEIFILEPIPYRN